MSATSLPPFPVDDGTLDLLEAAITTANADGASSLFTTLDLLAGINPDEDDAHLTKIGENIYEDDRIHYSPHDCILALIAEVRRLREVS
jgi:hypothetical protein